MNAFSRKFAQIALIAIFASPVTLLAADIDANDHNSHHPAQAQAAATTDKSTQETGNQIQERMQTRMLAMRNTSDPAARQDMMMAQMQDMSAMMANMGTGCPMMAQGMMGGKGGMMGSKGGMMGDNMPGKSAK